MQLNPLQQMRLLGVRGVSTGLSDFHVRDDVEPPVLRTDDNSIPNAHYLLRTTQWSNGYI
jgi:hypothetical protein